MHIVGDARVVATIKKNNRKSISSVCEEYRQTNIRWLSTYYLSSFPFPYLLLFGFVKLVFGAVLAGIAAALAVVIAYLLILYAFEEVEAFVPSFY